MSIPNTTQTVATRWRLDPSDSSAEFRVPHFWGLVPIKGRFERLDGWLDLGQNGYCELELTIDAASLNTGNGARDAHLRSSDFFDSDHHPEVRFRSTSARDAGDGRLDIAGELEVAGTRVALELRPDIYRASDHLEVDLTTILDQREFGMTWSPLGIARTPTRIVVHANLRPQA